MRATEVSTLVVSGCGEGILKTEKKKKKLAGKTIDQGCLLCILGSYERAVDKVPAN